MTSTSLVRTLTPLPLYRPCHPHPSHSLLCQFLRRLHHPSPVRHFETLWTIQERNSSPYLWGKRGHLERGGKTWDTGSSDWRPPVELCWANGRRKTNPNRWFSVVPLTSRPPHWSHISKGPDKGTTQRPTALWLDPFRGRRQSTSRGYPKGNEQGNPNSHHYWETDRSHTSTVERTTTVTWDGWGGHWSGSTLREVNETQKVERGRPRKCFPETVVSRRPPPLPGVSFL